MNEGFIFSKKLKEIKLVRCCPPSEYIFQCARPEDDEKMKSYRSQAFFFFLSLVVLFFGSHAKCSAQQPCMSNGSRTSSIDSLTRWGCEGGAQVTQAAADRHTPTFLPLRSRNSHSTFRRPPVPFTPFPKEAHTRRSCVWVSPRRCETTE